MADESMVVLALGTWVCLGVQKVVLFSLHSWARFLIDWLSLDGRQTNIPDDDDGWNSELMTNHGPLAAPWLILALPFCLESPIAMQAGSNKSLDSLRLDYNARSAPIKIYPCPSRTTHHLDAIHPDFFLITPWFLTFVFLLLYYSSMKKK